jgi:hypothetical protein
MKKTNPYIAKNITKVMENELKPLIKKDLLKKRIQGRLIERKDSDNFPGKVVTSKTLKIADKQNNDAMKAVGDKI